MSDRFHHFFIATTDLERALGFYRGVLGWGVTHQWGEAGDAERGAILSSGGMKVVIALRATANSADEYPSVHLDIHDIDTRFGEIPAGPHVVHAPEATKWGTRWFVLRDPDGTLVAFEEIRPRGR